jgi:O-antigen/teichoic acid export membrane protein
VLGYVQQLAFVVVGFWLTPFLIGHLGPRDYGLWLMATQVMGFLALSDLGIVAILPRETAYCVGRAGGWREAHDLPRLIGRTARVVLWQLPVVVGVAASIWWAMPTEWEPLRRPLALALVVFVAVFPFRLFGAVVQGLQDLTFYGAVQSVAWLASTAATVTLILRGFGLEALAISWVIAQSTPLIYFLRLRGRWSGVLPPGIPSVTWSEARGHISSGLWISVNSLGLALLGGVDLILVGRIWGPAAVFPLACTAKLLDFLGNQPTALLYGAAPGLSELRMAAPARLATVSMALAQAVLIGSGAVACVVLPVNAGFVRWWIGPDAYAGLPVTGVIVLVMMLRHWNTTNVFTLVCCGRERRTSITFFLDGLITLGASFALITYLGRLGAPLGELAGLVLVSLPANLLALATETGTTVGGLLKGLVAWAWRVAVLLALGVLVACRWDMEGLPRLALIAGVFAACYALLMLPLLVRPPLDGYIRHHLPRLWRLLPGHRSPQVRSEIVVLPSADP